MRVLVGVNHEAHLPEGCGFGIGLALEAFNENAERSVDDLKHVVNLLLVGSRVSSTGCLHCVDSCDLDISHNVRGRLSSAHLSKQSSLSLLHLKMLLAHVCLHLSSEESLLVLPASSAPEALCLEVPVRRHIVEVAFSALEAQMSSLEDL